MSLHAHSLRSGTVDKAPEGKIMSADQMPSLGRLNKFYLSSLTGVLL